MAKTIQPSGVGLPRVLAACVLLGIASAAATPTSLATPRAGVTYDFTTVDAAVENLAVSAGLEGLGIAVVVGDEVVYERFLGQFDESTTVPIASATKWMSGALVMSLVDEGLISLDDTTSDVLGWNGTKGEITLRQCFAHTSGLPGSWGCLTAGGVTLAQCVAGIRANAPLRGQPGETFAYGSASMHVGGRMAEVAGGAAWVDVFEARIASPLGLTSTTWNNASNPLIAGGLTSSLRDYTAFMRMLIAGGEFDGAQVLSSASVEALLSDQTENAATGTVPNCLELPLLGYGVGCWIEGVDANEDAAVLTSPGGLGFTPWLDRERAVAGVVMVQTVNALVCDELRDLRALVAAVVDNPIMPSLPGDLNGDATVDSLDLGIVLGAFGASSAGDANGDGVTDALDLGVVLGAFGD